MGNILPLCGGKRSIRAAQQLVSKPKNQSLGGRSGPGNRFRGRGPGRKWRQGVLRNPEKAGPDSAGGRHRPEEPGLLIQILPSVAAEEVPVSDRWRIHQSPPWSLHVKSRTAFKFFPLFLSGADSLVVSPAISKG